MNDIILQAPIVTEKSMNAVSNNCYTFEVYLHATKAQIKTAVENQFKVTVVETRVFTRKGKTKHAGKLRTEVQRSNKKYARVRIKPGQTIDIFTITPEKTK